MRTFICSRKARYQLSDLKFPILFVINFIVKTNMEPFDYVLLEWLHISYQLYW